MQKKFAPEIRHGLLIGLGILILLAAVFIIPKGFRSQAIIKSGDGLVEVTKSRKEGIENYDIRTDESKAASAALEDFRRRNNIENARIAEIKDQFARGEKSLSNRLPSLKVEYGTALSSPESIEARFNSKREFLTAPSNNSRVSILRGFLKNNNELLGSRRFADE